jgi:hypothetical protein
MRRPLCVSGSGKSRSFNLTQLLTTPVWFSLGRNSRYALHPFHRSIWLKSASVLKRHSLHWYPGRLHPIQRGPFLVFCGTLSWSLPRSDEECFPLSAEEWLDVDSLIRRLCISNFSPSMHEFRYQISIPVRIIAMGEGLWQAPKDSTIQIARNGAYGRRTATHSWIVSWRTCSILSDWIRTLLIELLTTCYERDPKSKCLCSAWRGYNSSKASMIVATSQFTVQWLSMGWREDIPQQSDRLIVDQIAQHWVIESFMAK